jgi:hypothetical protein
MAATGTGLARRRLTLDEALDGLLPEPFEPHEWLLMHMRSRQLQREALNAQDAALAVQP